MHSNLFYTAVLRPLALGAALWALPAPVSAALGQPPPGRREVLRLALPKRAAPSVRLLHDQQTLVLNLENFGDVAALQKALLRHADLAAAWVGRQSAFEAGEAFAVQLPPPRGLRLYLSLPERVQKASGRSQAGTYRLEVEGQSPATALKEHIMHYYVPQLGAAQETADSLRAAEALLLAGRLGEATDSFNDLLRIYPLRPWAALRLADVGLLQRGTAQACADYRRVHDTYAGRAAGLVAGMHAAVLGCAEAPTNNRQEWESLLLRARADDSASRWLAAEAHWALRFSRDVDLLEQALAYGPRVLGKSTFDHLFVHLMLQLPPLRRVSFARAHRDAILAHPDAADLKILEVQALCALDLNLEASHLADSYAQKQAGDAYLLGAGQCHADAQTLDHRLARADRRATFANLQSLTDRLRAIAQASAADRDI